MGIQNWSDDIMVVELADDPQFSEELANVMDAVETKPADVVLNFSAVSFINSSNIAKLLRLRKQMMSAGRRLILCDVNTQAWGVFLVTGLDKIFEFINDISTALASLQISDNEGKRQA
jgi:anti-anti-sigma factor